MATTTHSPGRAPVSPALNVLRVVLAGSVVLAGLFVSLAALLLVATNPLAVVLLGFPAAVAGGFATLFGVGRLGAAVAERV